MSIMDIFKKVPAPATLTADELQKCIIQLDIHFKTTMNEAIKESRKAQECFDKLFDARPEERLALNRQKAAHETAAKRKLGQAQILSRQSETYKDAEVVLRMGEAFAASGFKREGSLGAVGDLQKTMQEAQVAIQAMVQSMDTIHAAVAVAMPAEGSALTAEERELQELFEAFDKETDPVKKEELKLQIKEKQGNSPMLTLG